MSEAHISRRQLGAMGFMAMLSPLFRQIPRAVTVLSGGVAWAAVLLGCALSFLPAVFLRALMRRAGPEEGLSEVVFRCLGRVGGTALLLPLAAFLLLYTGFLLRSGADRFIATLYPNSQPWLLMGIMAALCLTASLGSLRALAGTAEVFLPLMLAVFVLVFALALPGVEPDRLLPLTAGDAGPVLRGGLYTLDLVSVVAYTAFLGRRIRRGNPLADLGRWVPAAGGLMLLLVVCCTGTLGITLTARLTNPFFVLLRSVSAFGMLKRFEALVISLWVISDFLLITCLLQVVWEILASALFRSRRDYQPGRLWDLRGGRWLLPVEAAVSAAAAVLLAGGALDLPWWALRGIPLLNAAFLGAVLPLTWLVGRLRHRV